MALYAFDGTWNEEVADNVTNVVKFRDAYKEKVEYLEGVGTRFGLMGRIFGGVFGAGGKDRIEEMLEKLQTNYAAGDKAVDVIGFSRGAALAVHFSNMLAKKGVQIEGRTEKPTIRFLGLWDVVASFGLPIDIGFDFHDINLGWNLDTPENATRIYHAMALHERRQSFEPTRMDAESARDNVEEMWFRGVHSDVGGGAEIKLSNIALSWMLEKALENNVPIHEDRIGVYATGSDPLAAISENSDPIENDPREVMPTDKFHPSVHGDILKVGERKSFKVSAPEQYNFSGFQLEEGGTYVFSVRDNDDWKDAKINCDANGWKTKDLPWYEESIIGVMEKHRRVPEANWFELIGTIGDRDDENSFRIGKGGADHPYKATKTGAFFAFANDLKSKYDNNHGEIELTVQRTE